MINYIIELDKYNKHKYITFLNKQNKPILSREFYGFEINEKGIKQPIFNTNEKEEVLRYDTGQIHILSLKTGKIKTL